MELHAHGLHLRLELSEPCEEGWFTCRVEAEVPGFSGLIYCWLFSADLAAFRSELQSMLCNVGRPCSASLPETEPGLSLQLNMLDRGHIEGRYRLQNFDAPGSPTLSGSFEMDQTYLEPLLAAIERALQVQRTVP